MYLNLKDCKWKVNGYWPNIPMFMHSMEVGIEFAGATDLIEATVPGGIHNDLLKAGIIDDPFFELNSLKCEWVENRWWKYATTFSLEGFNQNRRIHLIFKGVDYKAHFYLNGKKLGEHEGMYEPVIFDITDEAELDGINKLEVILENAPEEMGQIGYTSRTTTQKSRFNYKWDFSTRMVNIGIWDDVLIEDSGEFTLEDTYIKTDFIDFEGIIDISTCIKGKLGESYTIRISVTYENEEVYTWEESHQYSIECNTFNKTVRIDDPKIWYVNGCGAHPLYDVRVELLHQGELSDCEEYRAGIRKLEYRKNEGSPEDSLPYTFVVNGEPVYIKGVNLTPFDHIYGSVSEETYDSYLMLLKNANINLVRVWGGGLIEKEYFYQRCDVHGIMVWQEFIQSSSGLDNIPSTNPHFLELLKASSIHAVKTRRNHVSHTVWSGGNELMDAKSVPVTYENPNICILKGIVDEFDPGKLFLPTSASGPNEFLNADAPGKNYDVHGNWKYEGTEKQYSVYNKSDSLLHSEFGVDGCNNYLGLKRFLCEKNLKVYEMKENVVWRHHGEMWDTATRDREIFGDITDLKQLIKCSQFIQAEGLRYALESNRRRKFQNSGSIIWQFNEPWPNVSCTNLVDYYKVPKMAYYWVKKAYSQAHVSLKYEKLFYSRGEEFAGTIFIHNSRAEQKFRVIAEFLDIHGSIIKKEEFNSIVSSNTARAISEVALCLSGLEKEIFFLKLRLYGTSGEELSNNLYIFSLKKEEVFSPLLSMEKGNLKIDRVDNGYIIKNNGKEVCLFIHGIQVSGPYIYFEDNYITLFPGEEQLMGIHPIMPVAETDEIEIQWDCFNGLL